MNTAPGTLRASADEPQPALLAPENLAEVGPSLLETRIGPSGFLGETRTEPLSFVSGTSNRAYRDSPAEIAMGSSGPSIDEPMAYYASGTIGYLNVDGLGSAIATNNPAGSVTSASIFDAWGNQKVATPTILHSFSYTGRELGEAGLLFYRARYQQPGIGRFTQEDPIRMGIGTSLYLYAIGDPLTWVDPGGKEIAYGNHPVFFGQYHSKVVITPENQARWAKDPRFQNVDSNGRRYMTIGAGPEEGFLIDGFNRKRDRQEKCNNKRVLPLPVRFQNEDEAIEALIRMTEAYNQHPLPYTTLPGIGKREYNSNSFISGLGQAAGFWMMFDTGDPTPGYVNPVPEGSFK